MWSDVTMPEATHFRAACLLPLLLLGSLAAPTSAQDEYSARFSDDLSAVEVGLCFDGTAPRWLQVNRGLQRDWVKVESGGSPLSVRRRGSRLYLPELQDDACIHYQVDLDRLVARGDRRLASRHGSSLLLAGNSWFWRGPRQRQVVVDVTLPEGHSVSVPWAPFNETSGPTQRVRFKPDHSSGSWSSLTAVGPFDSHSIPVSGTWLRAALVGVASSQKQRKLIAWLQESAAAVAAVHGQFPQKTPQVLVIDIGHQREPVPWAQIQRGGGVSAHFFVDADRSARSFRDDWTATHEFAHMLLPYVSSSDRWLSEGLASYYQNILRARDGRLSEEAAWRKLHAGFRRGIRDDSNGEISLAEVSRRMRSERAYMRVYWSGAAVMLLADVRLRDRTDGRQSLDTALNALRDCCFENGRTWRARELFSRLDQLTGTRVFSELYAEHARSEDFPDVQPTYRALGVEADSRWIGLQNDARLADVRRAITQG